MKKTWKKLFRTKKNKEIFFSWRWGTGYFYSFASSDGYYFFIVCGFIIRFWTVDPRIMNYDAVSLLKTFSQSNRRFMNEFNDMATAEDLTEKSKSRSSETIELYYRL